MNDQTSSRVSTEAAHILRLAAAVIIIEPAGTKNYVDAESYNRVLESAKILAGSCLSQDETPGQDKIPETFPGRLKLERAGLSGKLDALTLFLSRGIFPPDLTAHHKEMLEAQRIHMSEYLVVLDARLADLGIAERSEENADDGA